MPGTLLRIAPSMTERPFLTSTACSRPSCSMYLIFAKSGRRFRLLAARRDHQFLGLGDGLGRVQALGADLGAVHDGVAAIELERVLEVVEALVRGVVAAVGDPAVGL